MSQYDNRDCGVLYENTRARTANAPHYTGSIEPVCPNCGTCSPFWLSGWWKETRVGRILSLAMNPKDKDAPTPKAAPAPTTSPINQTPVVQDKSGDSGYFDGYFDDDIPF